MCYGNALNLSLSNHSQLLVSSLRSCTRGYVHKKKQSETKKKEMLSDLIFQPTQIKCIDVTYSSTCCLEVSKTAAPDLEFQATLDENLIGLESSFEAEI